MAKKVNKKEEKSEKFVIPLLVVIIILLAVILGIVLFRNKDNNVIDNNNSNYQDSIEDNDNQNNSTDNKNYIGKDQAISIALKNIKLTKNDVYDLECELDNEFNQVVYEVTFNYKNLEYEYYINAESGKIIHSFKELD